MLRHYNKEEFNKLRKKKALINFIISVSIGAVFALISIVNSLDNDEPFMLAFGIGVFVAFLIGGIYFLRQPSLMDKKDNNYDNTESKLYKEHQKDLEFRKNELMKKARKHRSLWYYLCFKPNVKAGALNLLFIAAGLLFVFNEGYYLGVFLLAIGAFGIVSLFRCHAGKIYEFVIDEYQKLGFNKTEAEDDFAESNVYIVHSNVLSVSRKIVFSGNDNFVIPVSSIVWVFTAYDKIEKDNRLTRLYHLCVLLDSGIIYQILCPEAECSLVTEDIVSSGINVTTGYSEEMLKLYSDDPENFRNALKPVYDIQYTPVNVYFTQYQIEVRKSQ